MKKFFDFVDRHFPGFMAGMLSACLLFLVALHFDRDRKPYCPHHVYGPCAYCPPASPGPAGPPIILGKEPPPEPPPSAPKKKNAAGGTLPPGAPSGGVRGLGPAAGGVGPGPAPPGHGPGPAAQGFGPGPAR